MRSVNKVLLMGHLAADPEVNTTQAGHTVAKFKIATNRDWKSSDGEKHQDTDFHRITAWRKLGEICRDYLTKGSNIYVEGRLMNNNWQDKEGKHKSITEVIADNIHFIKLKRSKENPENGEVNLIEVSE